MKLNLDIKKSSSPEWIATVMSNFDEFLKDHADCERKASAMAMSFVAKYPDRIASVAETRGAERFRMVEEALDDVDLKKFYKMLWTSEAKHGHIYIKMALHYFSSDVVYSRLEYWLDEESKIIEELPLRPALH